jgi:hypothetical protein
MIVQLTHIAHIELHVNSVARWRATMLRGDLDSTPLGELLEVESALKPPVEDVSALMRLPGDRSSSCRGLL